MARAYPQPTNDDAQDRNPDEWRALRGELVELLDQVENEYARHKGADVRGLADRMSALREQVRAGEPDDRHREALKSVKRAIDRFSERDESYMPNQREALESAINEIRARQTPEPKLRSREPQVQMPPPPIPVMQQPQQQVQAQPQPAPVPPPAPRQDLTPRFDEIGHAVSGISSRLERLEVELKTHRPNQSAVKDIADQVAQVSQVVELLAGAVGETGQVKRLEGQIASLAKLVTQGQRVDMSALTQRLDDVSATVERLADLQIQHVSREKEIPAQQAAMKQAIDQSVRSVYERIEQIEKNVVLSPTDVQRLTAEMARFADLLRNPQPPAQMMALVEALHERIGEIEMRGSEVKNLKGDIEAMRIALMQRLDLGPLTQRLEDVTATVDRMADQQLRDRDRDMPAQQAAIKTGMQAIEKSIRAIYDRIDGLEQNYTLQPEDIDKLTTGLSRITEAIHSPEPPHELIALVDALNARIGEMESRDNEVSGLKHDMADLREAVLSAVEPRLMAVETQLSALNERIAEQPPMDLGVGQLEAQVRQLVARMDQTGEQITGLARLYSENLPEQPDYEALAEMVAARTTEAMAPRYAALADNIAARTTEAMVPRYEALADDIASRTTEAIAPRYEALADTLAARTEDAIARSSRAIAQPGLSEDNLAELEDRMARLFEAAAREKPPEDFSAMYDGIRHVDNRLERLEDLLVLLKDETAAAMAARPAAPEPAPVTYYIAEPVAAPPPPPVVDEAPQQVFTASTPPRKSDAMPTSPAEERPLTDRPFPDLGPVKAALEARSAAAARKLHPGLSDKPLDIEEMTPITPEMLGGATRSESDGFKFEMPPSAFDPSKVPTPPRPNSSLEFVDKAVFPSGTLDEPRPEAPAEPASSSSRNTFIEAARRAAQRPVKNDAAANSLISKALARFTQPTAKKPDAPVKAERPAKPEPKEEAKPIEPMVEAHAIADAASDAPVPVVREKPASVAGAEEPESFLSKHRQPILLAASVVALSFLTLNLINQRQAADGSQDDVVPGIQSIEEADAANNVGDATPLAAPKTEISTAAPPRVIPMVDSSIQTGSIDPAAAQNFAPASAMAAMPSAFKAITENAGSTPADTVAPPDLSGPVKVELPPDGIGPLDLRQAAADGDARAQFEVAAIYTEGRAVPQDLELAATWYERSAAQGFAPAQYRLGNLYENGKGVKKDLDQARLWYQRAAEAGNRMSMHNLAALYAGGELGKQDFAAAAGWFEKAATQGLTDSQFNLGMLYARGLGVTQNMEASYKWFALAARNGDQDAAKARDDVARSIDADTMTRLTAEVDAWKAGGIDLAANFAPIGTWTANFDPGQVIDNKDVVVGVQTLLTRLGYDVGAPDGVAGPKTAEAIKAFEKATGMTEVGAINPRLLAVLGSQPG